MDETNVTTQVGPTTMSVYDDEGWLVVKITGSDVHIADRFLTSEAAKLFWESVREYMKSDGFYGRLVAKVTDERDKLEVKYLAASGDVELYQKQLTQVVEDRDRLQRDFWEVKAARDKAEIELAKLRKQVEEMKENLNNRQLVGNWVPKTLLEATKKMRDSLRKDNESLRKENDDLRQKLAAIKTRVVDTKIT